MFSNGLKMLDLCDKIAQSYFPLQNVNLNNATNTFYGGGVLLLFAPPPSLLKSSCCSGNEIRLSEN